MSHVAFKSMFQLHQSSERAARLAVSLLGGTPPSYEASTEATAAVSEAEIPL